MVKSTYLWEVHYHASCAKTVYSLQRGKDLNGRMETTHFSRQSLHIYLDI